MNILQQDSAYNDENEWEAFIRFAAFLYTKWKIIFVLLLISMTCGILISNSSFQKNKATYIFTKKFGSSYTSLNNLLNPDTWKISVGWATGNQISLSSDYNIISEAQIFSYFLTGLEKNLGKQKGEIDNKTFSYKLTPSRKKNVETNILTISTNENSFLYDKLIETVTAQALQDVNKFIISAADSERIDTIKALTFLKKTYNNVPGSSSNSNENELTAITAQLTSIKNYEFSKINIKPYLFYQDRITKPSRLEQTINGAVSGLFIALTLILVWFIIQSIEWRKITEYQKSAVK